MLILMSEVPDRVDQIRAQWAEQRPEIDTSPQAILGRLHRLALGLSARHEAVYAQFGLNEGEFDLLCALRRAGLGAQRRPAELANETMFTTGGMTKRLDRLERAGLVDRAPVADGDRRAKLVSLTPAGLDLIERAFDAHMDNEHRLVAGLSTAQREELEQLLRQWSGDLGLDGR